LLTACGGGSSSGSSSSAAGDANKPVKMVWMHNQNTDPGKAFFQKIADEYHAKNPNVTIEIQSLQNEDLKTKIPVALQSPTPPDIIQQWGGAWQSDQVAAGKLKDISADVAPWIGDLGATVNGWLTDGKTYGIPYTLGIVGFWYNKALFAKAGITTPPATWADFIAATAKLKASGTAPISVGAKDKWPTAFLYDYLAVRECSKDVITAAQKDYKFTDPCWTKAGTDLKQLVDAQPFQKGFLGTPAQQGAGSSAGLLANGKAAMELMGHWQPSVVKDLTPDKKGMGDNLGWFPFPSVTGGAGPADAVLGGGDGFSCTVKSPAACADFLKYLVSAEVQTRFAALNAGLPTNKGAVSAVTDPNMKTLLEIRDKSSFAQTYLDVAFGTEVGNALNDAVSLELAGTSTPEGVVKAISDAAANK